jgi:multidrug efflux system outer membrane protein
MKRLYDLSIVLVILAVVSCAPFDPAGRMPPKDLVAETYSGGDDGAVPLNRWWESFGDTQLTGLVEEALGSNFSLRESWARLDQARALAVQSGARLIPDLSLTTGASVSRQGTRATTDTVESYSLGLTSGYEIDLWGRLRSEQQAAALAVAATREDLNAAAVTLAANVATRWIGVISQRMQKALLEQQLASNQTLLELVELRFRKSLASALDVFQQRQVVAQSRAQLPLVEQIERELLNELTLLLGRAPFAVPSIRSTGLILPTDIPATGLPARLLAYRPDIRAAMRRLEAADYTVAAARADRLPAISLTARAAYSSDEWRLLFDNWLLNLAGN